MKTTPLISALVGMLFVGSVITFYLACRNQLDHYRLKRLQRDVVAAQVMKNTIDALFNDAEEYSKRNPAIIPILRSAIVRQGNPPAQPAPKAQTK